MTEHRDDALTSLITACTNWGRWGPDDEAGAVNLITADAVLRAAAEVRSGRIVSLALPLDATGPQSGGRRYNPRLTMTATGTDHLAQVQRTGRGEPLTSFGYGDDNLDMPTQAGTHIDALSHVFFDGRMYNGYSAQEVTASGAARNGITSIASRLVTRGILLDVARHLGVAALEPGFEITTALLAEVGEAQQSPIAPGDALLVHTGFLAQRRANWGDYAGGDAPGLGLDAARFLRAQEVSLVASDTWGLEVRPNRADAYQPLHLVSLVHSGIPFGENFVLDELATVCAQESRWSFLLVAACLPITGASGSPVNPLAIL